MTCYHPVPGFRLDDGSVRMVERGSVHSQFQLACGQCIGCRLDKARDWSLRCMHEASLHDESCFVTLTYSDENVPEHGSLRYRDVQLFLKRLRKSRGRFRYYVAGEYGDTLGRPHYHALLFGYRPTDLVYWQKGGDGQRLYTSEQLEAVWRLGFVVIGDVTEKSAGYCARYVMKKRTGKDAGRYYQRVDAATGECFPLEPEFNHMSLKPGLGAGWFEKFSQDCVVGDAIVAPGGRSSRVPRYYDKLHARVDADAADWNKSQRVIFDAKKAADCTPERLSIREKVVEARVKSLLRS